MCFLVTVVSYLPGTDTHCVLPVYGTDNICFLVTVANCLFSGTDTLHFLCILSCAA